MVKKNYSNRKQDIPEKEENYMLKILKENELVRPSDIEKKYPNCKYIFTDFIDINNLKGHLYAISDSPDSYRELCDLSGKLSDQGVNSCIMGEYSEGGLIGVLREYEE